MWGAMDLGKYYCAIITNLRGWASAVKCLQNRLVMLFYTCVSIAESSSLFHENIMIIYYIKRVGLHLTIVRTTAQRTNNIFTYIYKCHHKKPLKASPIKLEFINRATEAKMVL